MKLIAIAGHDPLEESHHDLLSDIRQFSKQIRNADKAGLLENPHDLQSSIKSDEAIRHEQANISQHSSDSSRQQLDKTIKITSKSNVSFKQNLSDKHPANNRRVDSKSDLFQSISNEPRGSNANIFNQSYASSIDNASADRRSNLALGQSKTSGHIIMQPDPNGSSIVSALSF